MADKESKATDNVAGQYYVDKTCISAKFCVSVAPNNFKMDEGGGQACVYKQPENSEEEEQVYDALAGCPVGAIGDDGEEK
jgi:ferredoxin